MLGDATEASPTIWNNLIYDSGADVMEYGINMETNSVGSITSPQIYHNTIYGNDFFSGVDGIYIDNTSGTDAQPDIQYNIITNFYEYGIDNNLGSPAIDYNDVWDNSYGNYDNCSAGLNNISVDPQFITPGSDFHLQTTPSVSPCIDTIPPLGNPAPGDIEGTSRPQGSDNDMGCYETTLLTYYTLNVYVSPSPGGCVTSLDGHIACPSMSCSYGGYISGYYFCHWEGRSKLQAAQPMLA